MNWGWAIPALAIGMVAVAAARAFVVWYTGRGR